MNFKTTIALLVLLVFVGVYLYIFEFKGDPIPDSPEEDNRPGQALVPSSKFDVSETTQVTIKKAGEDDAVFRKQDDRWWQVEPVRFPLTDSSVMQLIVGLADLRSSSTIDPSEDDAPSLSRMNLDPPQATVVVKTKTKPVKSDDDNDDEKEEEGETIEHVYHFGSADSAASSDWGYVRVGDEPIVHVIKTGQAHRAVLTQTANDYRSRRVPGPDTATVSKVVLQQPTGTVTAMKSDESSDWSLTVPHAGRVDRARIAALVEGLSSLTVQQFTTDKPDEPALYGLDQPSVVVTVVSHVPVKDDASRTDRVTHTLTVGRPTNIEETTWYATYASDRVSPIVFEIPAPNRSRFLASADDLRDPRLVLTKTKEARRIDVERTDAPGMQLVREASGWRFDDPKPGYEPESLRVSKIIDNLRVVRAAAYAADVKPEGQPVATVRLYVTGDDEPETLQIFPAPESAAQASKRRLVLRNKETTGYIVDFESLADVFAPRRTFRDLLVADVKPDDLTRVTLRRPDGTTWTFERSNESPEAGSANKADQSNDANNNSKKGDDETKGPGRWVMVGHDVFEHDMFVEMVDAVSYLRAVKWLADDEKPGEQSIELTLESAEGSPVVLRIDPQTARAMRGSVAMPFQVSQMVVRAVNDEYRYRTIVPVKADQIAQVVVKRGDKTWTIKADDKGALSADDLKLNALAMRRLFSELAGLRVERFIQPLPGVDPPAISFDITDNSGKTYGVSLLGLAGELRGKGVVRGENGRTFVIPDAVVQALEADLTQAPPVTPPQVPSGLPPRVPLRRPGG